MDPGGVVARVLAGIDEAGRGPVVGPLVVAMVASEDVDAVAALGVRDSKLLSPARRVALDREIRGVAAKVSLVELHPAELDERMGRHSLNRVELDAFVRLGRRVRASTYFLDACDTDAPRFGRAFLGGLRREDDAPVVVSEHGADARYPLVSAASIVAKVRRDLLVARIARRLEPSVGLPLGSGYSHDVRTRAFLAKYLEVHGRLPEEARARWETSRLLIQGRSQRTLPGLGPPPRPAAPVPGTGSEASRSST